MLYGATGCTSNLIARRAKARAAAVLGGPDAAAVRSPGQAPRLPHPAIALDDPATLSAALDGMELV